MTPPVNTSANDDAFSLVEVVLAIGIVAFAFVAILGLLPVGMTTFRQAMDTATGSQIIQRVINEAQQTDFPTLIKEPRLERYFDDQGNEVESLPESIYTVEVRVAAITQLPAESNLGESPSLATVMVKVVNNPGHDPDPFDTLKPFHKIEQTAYIAKSQ